MHTGIGTLVSWTCTGIHWYREQTLISTIHWHRPDTRTRHILASIKHRRCKATYSTLSGAHMRSDSLSYAKLVTRFQYQDRRYQVQTSWCPSRSKVVDDHHSRCSLQPMFITVNGSSSRDPQQEIHSKRSITRDPQQETHIKRPGHLFVQLLGDLLVHVQLPVLVLVTFQLFHQLILKGCRSAFSGFGDYSWWLIVNDYSWWFKLVNCEFRGTNRLVHLTLNIFSNSVEFWQTSAFLSINRLRRRSFNDLWTLVISAKISLDTSISLGSVTWLSVFSPDCESCFFSWWSIWSHVERAKFLVTFYRWTGERL